MILIDCRHHHAPNVERLLSSGISLIRQNLSNQGEAFVDLLAVRITLHIAVDGIAGCSASRKPLPRKNISMVVMPEKNLAGFINVPRPVLCLPVDPHDAVISS